MQWTCKRAADFPRWATNPEGMKLTHLVGGPGNIEPGYWRGWPGQVIRAGLATRGRMPARAAASRRTRSRFRILDRSTTQENLKE